MHRVDGSHSAGMACFKESPLSVERWAKIIMLVTVAAATGCGSGRSPWSGQQVRHSSGPTPPSMVARSSSSGFDSRGRAVEPSRTERISQAVNNTVRRAGNAMTIEPRVVRESDPTDLVSATMPVGVDVYLAAARVSETQKQDSRADEQYKRALEVDPHHRNALIGYARFLDRVGDVAQAETLYRRSVDAHGEDALVYNDLGMFYARRQLFDESISALVIAVRIAPYEKRYRNNIATVLVQQNRGTEAYTHLAAVHHASIAHYNLGLLYQHNGQFEMARQQFQTALQSDPSMQEARDRLLASRLESNPRSDEFRDRSHAPSPQTPHSYSGLVSQGATLRYPAFNQGSSAPSTTPALVQRATIAEDAELSHHSGSIRQVSYSTDVIRQPRPSSSMHENGAPIAPLPAYHIAQ